MAIKCPKCKAENTETSVFCAGCGAKLEADKEFSLLQTETLQIPVQELHTGSTFAGRYQVIEELGRGGMGKVYKVVDTKIKEKLPSSSSGRRSPPTGTRSSGFQTSFAWPGRSATRTSAACMT